MKWCFSIVFFFVFHLGEILSQNLSRPQLDSSTISSQIPENVGDEQNSKIIKRDVLDDLKRKINKDNMRKNLRLWSTESPIKKMNLKNFSNFQSKGRSAGKLPSNKHAEMYKDLQNRVQELRTRMSAGKHHPHPYFKARANFDDKLDVKEYYRKAVEDLHEKFKNPKTLQNRIDISSSKLGSAHKKNKEENNSTAAATSTTEKSKVSHIPVVVLMPSSTPQQETDAKKTDSVMERFKEKQKDAVTKMKFSLAKNREDASEKDK